ncbi:histidine kinase [Algoriphagus hitonicola]|uniref:7TM diverse intracellular signalling n=1 Tax=Algoriphagus hitonicola TaxID=435880 RepID=A0A1I2WM53_9BACT|nr:histidine kinase [Algoriphagus hitonicola]SFH02428.1 7TM diverse intracellular signalling [Algoriphagus hitonicola]
MDRSVEHLMNFLENSNRNGLALMAISILFYLAVFHLILYIKNREKYFLHYSTYAFVNAVALIGRPYESFLKEIYFTFPEFFRLSITPLQFISFIVFSYFLIEILRLKSYYPRFIQFYIRYTVFISLVYGVFFLGVFFWDGYDLMRQFYFFVFMPITLIFTLIGIFLIVKSNEKVKAPILYGFLAIGIAAFLFGFLAAEKDTVITDRYFYILYVGILIENFFFTYALAIKQRENFEEKIKIQDELLFRFTENGELRAQLNRQLQHEIVQKEEKIIELESDAESERMSRIKAHYERKITELHLRSLRSQMNPHFIFNALNSIKVFLIEKDKDRAILYLNRFSKLIRLVLESSRKTKISLGEELVIAQLYLTLESIRFEDGIELKMQVAEDVRLNEIELPPLLLQPFFENAIWHGLMNRAGEKWIKVVLKRNDKGHLLSIRDNGIGRKASQEINAKRTMKKESIGMSLSKERLELFNQNERVYYHFDIIDHEGDQLGPSGTEVIFYLEGSR